MISGRDILAISIILMLVFSGCNSKNPAVVSATPTLRVNCNPGFITKELPELASQFDALPPGSRLIVVLYGNFPSADHLGHMLTGIVRIERGTFSVKFKNGDITYEANGNVILNWKTRSLQALENPISDATELQISLQEDCASAAFSRLTLRDGKPEPEEDRTNFLFLPTSGADRAGDYILEIQKSSDFFAKPSNFSVTRGL